MVKTICFDKRLFIASMIIIILILGIVIYNFNQPSIINNFETQGIENSLKRISNNLENYQNNQNNQNNKEVIQTISYPTAVIDKDPKSLNSLDRIYNPLRYPYKSDYFYDQSWYPNLQLPFQVIGGGYRNTPTLGGTEVPIMNPTVPIDISNRNIAPVNVSTRGPLGQPQQLGVLYKISGNDNDILPLYGRRRYPNDTKYDYYTTAGQFGTKVPVVTKNKNNELGNNDVVFIKGNSSPYRVTIYESDFPSYIPYM